MQHNSLTGRRTESGPFSPAGWGNVGPLWQGIKVEKMKESQIVYVFGVHFAVLPRFEEKEKP